jgi:hypothetical protein
MPAVALWTITESVAPWVLTTARDRRFRSSLFVTEDAAPSVPFCRARAADDLPELPLVPIYDGLTDEERTRAWNADSDAAEALDLEVTAAETLAEVRAERGR